LAYAIDVPRKHSGNQLPPGVGDRHDDAALVLRRRRTRDQAALVQQPRLVGEPAPAVDHPVGQVGHPQPSLGRVDQPCQDLKLHIAEVAVGAQVLIDRVLKNAADFHQSEVRPELLGIQTGHRITHPAIVRALNSKCARDAVAAGGRDR
jgi:hypothetical protein